MGLAFVFAAEERSIFVASMPSFVEVQNAVGAINASGLAATWNIVRPDAPSTPADWGGWLGPGPRITRPPPLPGTRFVTRMACVWEFADTPFTRTNLRAMTVLVRIGVAGGLANQSADWGEVLVAPHAEPTHGALAWWRSGEAAVTRTRDAQPELIGRFGTDDNPVGPTTAATHPLSLADALRGGATGLFGVALAIGGITAAVVLGPRLVGWVAGSLDGRREPRRGR